MGYIIHTLALRYAKYIAKECSAENKMVVKLQKHVFIGNLANFFSTGVNSILPLNVRNAISLSHFKYFVGCNSAH